MFNPKYLLFTFLLLFKISFLNAQYGGWASYSFLKLPVDGFTTSIGGQNVAPVQSEIGYFLNNPALSDTVKKNYLKINFAPLWAGTTATSLIFAQKFNKIGLVNFGLQYFNYGSFVGTDAAGNITNPFTASDFAITVGHSELVNNIAIGANIKLAGSNIDTYSALALLVDFGGYFIHPKKELSFGLSVKNMGAHLKKFTDLSTNNLPFDVQMGASFRPDQMPFRFLLNIHHLHKWDIANDESEQTTLFGGTIASQSSSFGKLAQHAILGVETIFSPHFQVNFGYNHLLRTELKQQNVFTFSGFSAGFLLKTKKYNFSVGRQGFHSAGGLTQMSFATKFK